MVYILCFLKTIIIKAILKHVHGIVLEAGHSQVHLYFPCILLVNITGDYKTLTELLYKKIQAHSDVTSL